MTQHAPLSVRDLSAGYQRTLALDSVSVTVSPQTIHAIVGPNGSGKSTLLKASLGLLAGTTGSAKFFGEPLDKVRPRVAYMPQTADVDWDFPIVVNDVVLMGTYPKLGWMRRPGRKQRALAKQAMEKVGLEKLGRRHISQLSGGQKQRVFVARLLAQEADLLLMDEPFAGIDKASEALIIDVLRAEVANGKTVIIVHHDLNNLASFCTHATLLSGGHVVESGDVKKVLAPQALTAAYGISSDLLGV
ncbi:manganese/zinc/iron transport system ATP-binding protein [Actinobaculum suis]|uniref:ABC transporter ATP-binding protein n=1 Tax=Actinobaculum suis TaxID=1657 RepID=A0A1G7CRB1_9ACTO|nr:ABC transporter ATP-binding protein [Actinobaculum suis]MDY5152469.1 ABC transporter ATP-binding protein [Actinobaculum suis]SDE41829.1 manganese/zinc/iron transport system ATP-binding protein [Actinobaculum suis]